MRVKGVVSEDFINFKIPSMYISTATCDFKCDKENGTQCCQNSSLAKDPTMVISDVNLIEHYLSNDITNAIVIGGLEPFDQFEEVCEFLIKLRHQYHCDDPVVIYTGYNKTEISSMLRMFGAFNISNIIIKFGRFIPGQQKPLDPVLGVELASDNQYAEQVC